MESGDLQYTFRRGEQAHALAHSFHERVLSAGFALLVVDSLPNFGS